MSYPYFRSSPGQSIRTGFTRVELLVFVVILFILTGIAFGPVSAYLNQHSQSRAVESARTINTLLAQYATDNNGVYPVGEGTPAIGKSEGIARNLLENNYTPDATVFAVGSTAKYNGTASDFSDLTAANLSWDFTAGVNETTGITSSASDYLPVVYTTGETVDYDKAKGHGLILEPSGKGPFGQKGVVVAYKGGNALFISAKLDMKEVQPAFIQSNFNDSEPYTQIRP
jgi:type II secretory pathway pseudopilin PulG